MPRRKRKSSRKLVPYVNLKRKHQPHLDGFEHLKFPTGYGAVSCEVYLNGNRLGVCWSRKTTYCDTEHAEDAVIDHIDCLVLATTYSRLVTPQQILDVRFLRRGENHLEIKNLTASPCTSVCRGGLPVTSKKIDDHGCTEKLIELQTAYESYGYKFNITISADHYYQPRGLGGGTKNASRRAVEYMQNCGITVNVHNN